MKRVIRGLLMTALCFSLALSQTQSQNAGKNASATSQKAVADELRQIENDWVSALKTKDVDRLGDILANDWMEMRWDGAMTSKEEVLADLKSPRNSLESFEMGPISVRLFGNTAIVTGRDSERSTDHGLDSSGEYVWTDVFVRQSGKWKAVASQSSKVPK
jgi:ketosteroid isomerase-like protein